MSAVPAPPLRGDALVRSRKGPGSGFMFVHVAVQGTGAKLRDCDLLSGAKENKPHWQYRHSHPRSQKVHFILASLGYVLGSARQIAQVSYQRQD